MPSPESDIATAYALGQSAAAQGAIRTANPYTPDGTYPAQQQFLAWNGGYDAAVKDQINAKLYTLPVGGTILMPPVRMIVSAAQTAQLFSSPLVAVPARQGFTHIPLSCVFYHAAAGAPFTIAGLTAHGLLTNGQLVCGYNGSGWLDSALEQCIKMRGPGSGSALYSGTDIKNGAGLPLLFGCLGANPAGGGTIISEIEFTYEDVYFG